MRIVGRIYRNARRKTIGKIYYKKHLERWINVKDIGPIYVNPVDIKYITGSSMKQVRGNRRHLERGKRPDYFRFVRSGDIMSGDWDKPSVEFVEFSEYKLLSERFKESLDWTDTSVFHQCIKRIDSGYSVWGCTTIAELKSRFEYLDDLKESIERDGYILNPGDGSCPGIKSVGSKGFDEVTVNINRNGNLLYEKNGRHRLSLAKILEIDEIPVYIHSIHSKYQGDLIRYE